MKKYKTKKPKNTTPDRSCRVCGSAENGYYTPHNHTCKRCQNDKLMNTQRETAERLGFVNYYQLQRYRKFQKILTRKTA